MTLLLEHGATLDARESQWGQTPLMFAAAKNRAAAVGALLRAGAELLESSDRKADAVEQALERGAADTNPEITDEST